MNLGEMETLLKRYGFDETDPLKQWLNAAMHEIETDHDWIFLEGKLENVASTAGGKSISLQFEASKVISVRDLTNNLKLIAYDWWRFFREIEEPEAEGQPILYTTPQGSSFINLWPIPEGIYKFQVLSQLSAKDMAAAGDTPKAGTTEWPLSMHFAIVLKAAITALFAENEEERGEKLQKQFDQLMERLRRRFAQRTMDEPSSVTDVMGYGSDSMSGTY